MAENPLRQLESCGQSVWTDYIRRSFVEDGDLRRLVEQDGITGVTSNPTIFEKAVQGSSDYDKPIRTLVEHGASVERVYQSLASTDVRMAADVLCPVWERTDGKDGFVSIEVSPEAAHSTQKTLDDAHLFWQMVDSPNLLIKVPATAEGIPAIEQLIAEGINVNITLIFALGVYEQVMEAYLTGLERRVAQGKPLEHVASVASFFVSRVDTLVDHLLEQKSKGASAQEQRKLKELAGQAAIANAKLAYQRFEQVFSGERYQQLAPKGAQLQRPLWASTSTKNPAYPDTYYVDHLVGPHTVNTMPLETIHAFRDHGKIPSCNAVREQVDQAVQVIQQLAAVGIDMKAVTDQLTKEGVQKFVGSLHGLYRVIGDKVSMIRAEASVAR